MIRQKYSHMYIVSLDHIRLFMLHSFYVIFHNTFSQNLQKCSITSNFFLKYKYAVLSYIAPLVQ